MKTNITQTDFSQTPSQEDIEREYQRRNHQFWNWLICASVYFVAVNLFLIAVNWFTSPHYWWVLWSIGGWGMGLLITAVEKSLKY